MRTLQVAVTVGIALFSLDPVFSQGTITPGGSASGSLSDTHNSDLYAITTASDGALYLNNTTGGTLGAYFRIFDTDGTTQRTSCYGFNAPCSTNVLDLKQGSYWIKAEWYINSGSYTINTVFKPEDKANDPEPNDSSSQAVSLAAGTAREGHLGYYGAGKRDAADWYSITTASDGVLKIAVKTDSGLGAYFRLYDSDPTVFLTSVYSFQDSQQVQATSLKAGSYYLKIEWYAGQGGYVITPRLVAEDKLNDHEPNNTVATAEAMLLDSLRQGHIGFYGQGSRDTSDWYSLTIADSGNLRLSVASDSGAGCYFRLYKNNGSTLVTSVYCIGAADQLDASNLAAGTCQVKVEHYAGAGGYTIRAYRPTAVCAPDAAGALHSSLTVAIYGKALLLRVDNRGTPGVPVRIDLIDAKGKIAESRTSILQAGGNRIAVPLSLAHGLYIIRISSGDRLLAMKKNLY